MYLELLGDLPTTLVQLELGTIDADGQIGMGKGAQAALNSLKVPSTSIPLP